jgi:hypothetical protein
MSRGQKKQRMTLKRFIGLTAFKSICNKDILTKSIYKKIYNFIKYYNYDGSFITNAMISVIAGLSKYDVDCDYVERYNLLITKYNKSNSLESYKLRYGKTGEDLFNEKNSKSAVTLKNMIKKHGEIVGKAKWDLYCKKQSYAGVKKEYFIEKHGIEEGTKKYEDLNKLKNSFRPELFSNENELNERKRACAITLENMIKKHGKEIGKEKFQKHDTWLRTCKK